MQGTEKQLAARWKPGQSGNPAGRPIGARQRFADAFVGDVAATWEKHGTGVLDKMAQDEPVRFAELCGRLIPRDLQVTLAARMPGNLEPEDWHLVTTILEAIRTALPDVNQRQPGEVMAFVLDAIRAHSSQLIIETSRLGD